MYLIPLRICPQGISDLQEVVPACLVAACPVLRTLRLSDCRLFWLWTLIPASLQACEDQTLSTQLQTLWFEDCDGLGGYTPQLLATTLAGLPALTGLELPDYDRDDSNDVCTQCCPPWQGS